MQQSCDGYALRPISSAWNLGRRAGAVDEAQRVRRVGSDRTEAVGILARVLNCPARLEREGQRAEHRIGTASDRDLGRGIDVGEDDGDQFGHGEGAAGRLPERAIGQIEAEGRSAKVISGW